MRYHSNALKTMADEGWNVEFYKEDSKYICSVEVGFEIIKEVRKTYYGAINACFNSYRKIRPWEAR